MCTLLALVLLLALLPVTAGAAEPTETVTLDLADDYIISITPENSQGKEYVICYTGSTSTVHGINIGDGIHKKAVPIT